MKYGVQREGKSTWTRPAVAWAFVAQKGLMKDTSRYGWGETITQLKGWLISGPEGLDAARWDFVNDVPRKADHGKQTLKLWFPATAKEPTASDMRRQELAIV